MSGLSAKNKIEVPHRENFKTVVSLLKSVKLSNIIFTDKSVLHSNE
jgi:hypothetical protein